MRFSSDKLCAREDRGPVNNDMLVLVAQGLTVKDADMPWNAHLRSITRSFQILLGTSGVTDGQSFHRRRVRGGRTLADDQPDDAFTPTIGQYEQFSVPRISVAGKKPIKLGRMDVKPHQSFVLDALT
jgi:hypothetical protein